MYRYFDIQENGRTIRCKLYFHQEQPIRHLVIFCHGFGGHKDNGAAEKYAQKMLSRQQNAAMLAFNWPCHGDDETQTLRLEDCNAYLEQVIRWARQELAPEKLFAYATSFGGYLTLKFLAENGNPFEKIALRCPAVNMYDVITGTIMSREELAAAEAGAQIPVGFDRKILIDHPFLLELRRHDVQKMDYSHCAGAMLILQGKEDEVVPFAAVERFAREQGIAFLPVDGADHRFQNPGKMKQAIEDILQHFDH